MFKIRERKHQARASKSVTLEKQDKPSSCAKCGKSYSEPIELTVRDKDSLETYQACPHCFSRAKVPSKIKKRPDEAAPSPPEKAMKTLKEIMKETEEKTEKETKREAKEEIEAAIEKKIETETEGDVKKAIEKDVGKEKPVGCEHSLGYLKKRPKGSPVPDECLTCASVMKCMGLA